MIRLGMPREPRWIDLPAGVRLKVRPLVTALMQAARFRAEKAYREQAEAWRVAADTGMADDLPALDTEDRKAALLFSLTVNEIASECVLDWEGVGDVAGEPIEVRRDFLPELMSHNGIAEQFWAAMTATATAVASEGNG